MLKRKLYIISLIIFFIVAIICGSPVTAHADTGPKPSVVVTFENLGDELCYGTLLSKDESTGPSSAWNGEENEAKYKGNEYYPYEELDYDIWNAFVDYKDSDGFYFLQETWIVSETKELAWTYYPPSEFKILLYYPEKDIFLVSDICEKYAFDSYYTVDIDGIDISSVEYDEELSGNERLEVYRSYNYKWELISLFARIIITIIIEMLVALAFCFREKKQLLLLVVMNTITQIILNVLLNLVNYNLGQQAFLIRYFLYEFIVFAVEAILLSKVLNRLSIKERPKWLIVLYTFIANVVSFIAGVYIAHLIPGIF